MVVGGEAGGAVLVVRVLQLPPPDSLLTALITGRSAPLFFTLLLLPVFTCCHMFLLFLRMVATLTYLYAAFASFLFGGRWGYG